MRPCCEANLLVFCHLVLDLLQGDALLRFLHFGRNVAAELDGVTLPRVRVWKTGAAVTCSSHVHKLTLVSFLNKRTDSGCRIRCEPKKPRYASISPRPLPTPSSVGQASARGTASRTAATFSSGSSSRNVDLADVSGFRTIGGTTGRDTSESRCRRNV